MSFLVLKQPCPGYVCTVDPYPCIKAICIMQDVDVHRRRHWRNSPTLRSGSQSIVYTVTTP